MNKKKYLFGFLLICVALNWYTDKMNRLNKKNNFLVAKMQDKKRRIVNQKDRFRA